MPRFSVISAMARNRVIGINNTLPWRLPEDLQHFKRLTLGHHLVMGRKTFESLGRPLPGRTSVVISRDTDYVLPEGCLLANSLETGLALCGGDPEVFCIGGAQLYAQALALADRLYLTEIAAEFAGDAWFPAFDAQAWQELERQPQVSSTGLEFAFVTYSRRSDTVL